MKHLLPPLLSAIICAIPTISAHAANVNWRGTASTGGDGIWSAGSFSTGILPDPADTIRYYRNGTYTSATANIEINTSAIATTHLIGLGKTVNFTFQSGAVFGGTIGLGYTSEVITGATGTGPSHLSMTSEAGTGALNLARLVLGYGTVGTPTANGHTATLTGEHFDLSITGASANSVGGYSNSNLLRVQQGAKVNVVDSGIAIGNTNYHGNRLEVDGAGTQLSVARTATTSSVLTVGAYNGAYNSHAIFTNGATVTLSHIASVDQNNGVLIGWASSHGNNFLEVSDGAKLTLNARTAIADFTTNPNNALKNRMSILSGGEVTVGASRLIENSGLLQLDKSSILGGTGGVRVQANGRFEAEGSGLAATVATTVQSGGTLAVGLDGQSEGELLTLNNTVTMAAGSTLEISLFGDGDVDQIHLAAGSGLNLTGNVTFSLVLEGGYVPELAKSWTIFTGNTDLIAGTGTFTLSGFDSPLWDLSAFNEEGGWELRTVPEPGTVGLLLLGAAVGAIVRFKRRA